jgi:hypothetical protein
VTVKTVVAKKKDRGRMRGPDYKLSGDVRRTWRCPSCGCQRKLQGNFTSIVCNCREDAWMQIVAERVMIPRPLQRPSDVERHPIDFGIEPSPPAPARPEATIVKSAISVEVDVVEITPAPEPQRQIEPPAEIDSPEEEWGEGIL